ncbi:MAG TPA: beta-ketoacyl-[acyl-carrier-protein] synthase family protein [Thermoanaerobaculia bacterium]
MTAAAPVRAVVTGVGVVSGWGWGVDPFWRGLLSGGTAIAPFSRFDPSAYRSRVAAEVPPAPAELARHVPGWERLAGVERYAGAAAREARAAAGLPGGAALAEAAVFVGSSTGGMLEGEEYYLRLRGAVPGPPRLALLAGQPVSSPAEAVARFAGAGGPVETVSSACASGTMALARALDSVRAGEVDLALAGGADSLCRITFGGFNSLRSVDERPCRPFRRDREGLSIGEGGAVLVVESAERAARRGAPVLAELAGAGASSDAGHMTAPHPEGEGAARALAAALADAALGPGDVAFVNAHGTGTPLNDAAEWQAMARVFGARAGRLPVSATKASVGHLLGSAGAIEAAATVLCLARGVLPPTAGEGEIDPETPVDLVVGERELPAGPLHAISLNLAFGGCNAALVVTGAGR